MEFSSALNKNGANFFARKWIGILYYNIKGDDSSFRERKKLHVLVHVQNLVNHIVNI